MKKIMALLGAVFISISIDAGYGSIFSKAVETNEKHAVAQQESKTDKQAIEDMILAAIDKNDTASAEVLLRGYPQLADDAQEVEQTHKVLSQSYKALQDVLVQSETVKKRTLSGGTDSATQEPARVPFFNHMLGNVAYNMHADKPAVIAANKNLALLKAAGTYINKIEKTYKEYIGDAGRCPICLDDFTQSFAPHPHISVLIRGFDAQEFSEVQNNSSKKEIIACKNNHGICVPCFYNPDHPSRCSLCREPLRYNQYNTCLQCGVGKDLHFNYCKSCAVVSVTCSACKTLSCCGALKNAVVLADHAPIKKQAEVLIKRCWKEKQEYQTAQQAEMRRIIEESEEKYHAELEKIKEATEAIDKRRADIKALIESKSGDREKLMHQEQYLIRDTFVYCQDGKAKIEMADKFKSDTKAHYKDKIKVFSDQKTRDKETIKKMVKDATGSDLVVPDLDSSLDLINLLSAILTND